MRRNIVSGHYAEVESPIGVGDRLVDVKKDEAEDFRKEARRGLGSGTDKENFTSQTELYRCAKSEQSEAFIKSEGDGGEIIRDDDGGSQIALRLSGMTGEGIVRDEL